MASTTIVNSWRSFGYAVTSPRRRATMSEGPEDRPSSGETIRRRVTAPSRSENPTPARAPTGPPPAINDRTLHHLPSSAAPFGPTLSHPRRRHPLPPPSRPTRKGDSDPRLHVGSDHRAGKPRSKTATPSPSPTTDKPLPTSGRMTTATRGPPRASRNAM